MKLYDLIQPTVGLEFDEPTHSYHYNGEPMESVTRALHKFSKPFDSEHHSISIAQREIGWDQDPTARAAEIREEWRLKALKATTAGDYVHAWAEYLMWQVNDRVVEADLTQVPDKYLGKCESVVKWIFDHGEIFQGFTFPELKVCYPKFRLAGTVDLVASNYQGVRSIVDWKQNEHIDAIGWTKYNNLLAPFTRGRLKLPDTPYSLYSLQLNMYRRIMMDRYGFEAEKLVLVHLTSSGYTEYPVRIMDEHIDKILETR
jgi:hypothetical protein